MTELELLRRSFRTQRKRIERYIARHKQDLDRINSLRRSRDKWRRRAIKSGGIKL